MEPATLCVYYNTEYYSKLQYLSNYSRQLLQQRKQGQTWTQAPRQHPVNDIRSLTSERQEDTVSYSVLPKYLDAATLFAVLAPYTYYFG